jgi:hypothetical protein
MTNMTNMTKKEQKIVNIITVLLPIIAPLAFIGAGYFFVFFFTIPQTYASLHFEFFMPVLGYGKVASFFLSLICGTTIVSIFAAALGSLWWVDSKLDEDDYSQTVIMLGGMEIMCLIVIVYLVS